MSPVRSRSPAPSLLGRHRLSCLFTFEQSQRNGLAHRPISSRIRMKMIAAVIGRKQAFWMLRIASHSVKINDCIEVSRSPDPLVDCLAVGLRRCRRMVVIRPNKRQDRCPEGANAVRMSPDDDLLVCAENAVHQRGVRSRSSLAFTCESAQIIYAFQNDHVTNISLCQDIAVESSQCIWAEP